MQRPSIAAATAPSSRLDGLDILRMFACLAVVLFHADIDILGGGTPVLEFGLWGVHVFMVLSGYLLTRPFLEGGRGRLELRSYFVKRLVRIVPAYYAVVFLAAGLILLGFGGERHVSSSVPMWWHVTSHLTFLHGWFAETKMSLLSALWSMSLEWQYYLVLPLLLWALRKVPVAALLFLVVALSLGFRAFICHGPLPGNEHLLAGFFLGRVPEFLLGMTLAALLGGHERRALHWMLGASAACLVVTAVLWGPVTQDLCVASGACLLVAWTRLRGPAVVRGAGARLLRYLGGASYSTYLVHLLAGKALLLALDRAGLRGSLPVGVIFAAYVLAGHVAGVLVFQWVERPGSALLGRWLRPLSTRQGASAPS